MIRDPETILKQVQHMVQGDIHKIVRHYLNIFTTGGYEMIILWDEDEKSLAHGGLAEQQTEDNQTGLSEHDPFTS